MPSSRTRAALIRLARDPASLRALAAYGVAAWLALGFWGYSLGMREFLSAPRWLSSGPKKQFSGPVTALERHGFWRFSHFRLRVGDSEELSIPPEVAHPLWASSPHAGEALSDYLHEGQPVSVMTTGGSAPVVLDLLYQAPDGRQEKLLDLQDSVLRFGAVRAHGELKASLAETMAVGLLPFTFALRLLLRLTRKKRRQAADALAR